MGFILGACNSESTTEKSNQDGSNSTESETTESGSEGDNKLTIGMTVINQEALFFTEMVKGAEAKAEELGVELNVYNANNNQVDQNNAVENFISEGVDAIIVNAIDPGALNPVVEKVEEAGISLISVDSVIEHEAVDVQIGVDNSEESVRMGEYFNEFKEEHWGDKEVKLGIVSALNAPIQVNRQDSFLETVESDSVEVVDIVDGENVQEKALTASENLFISNPDLDAVFVTGEPAYIGAVSAVNSQGKQDSVKLFGWDLSPQVVQGIDQGYVESVIQQHPDKYGEEAVKSAVSLINGEEVESLIGVPATIVTEDNVDDFRSLFE
ncbi:substrate-binding domain-containing protein [Salinibacillus xinjiangensis]|uniref:Substrate-binding domain-containing protein n=2 Tax=Salinibacillus xinjiangensis TaxID=1229268 RepID=A0A6G1XAV3_9BACI|nr:substrate-binding domain-containing protein [Salinibacillus xinjiangensis]